MVVPLHLLFLPLPLSVLSFSGFCAPLSLRSGGISSQQPCRLRQARRLGISNSATSSFGLFLLLHPSCLFLGALCSSLSPPRPVPGTQTESTSTYDMYALSLTLSRISSFLPPWSFRFFAFSVPFGWHDWLLRSFPSLAVISPSFAISDIASVVYATTYPVTCFDYTAEDPYYTCTFLLPFLFPLPFGWYDWLLRLTLSLITISPSLSM